ncbi:MULTISPECIES: S8 family serine peptidase [unclassified Geodermatophilus]|uniref:S8 family serine peptidase n=1 Tax=unclassified Geodermatophilus TaxID=2637632 RepID=UPI003EEFDFF4
MDLPAWSEPFTAERLGTVRPLGVPITREWAWGGSTGRGVKVAVIDSGVDGGHPRVGGVDGAVALEYDPDAPDDVRVLEGPHEDLFGHGTACAGVIRGLAPDCEIHSVRVLGRRLTGKGLVFAAGLRWAIQAGMDVVNLSLSTSRREYFPLFHELADEAYFRRVLLVSAVNNTPAASYPSLYSSVCSVAARPGPGPGFAYNPDPPVEFGAAGVDVDVAWLDGGAITATGNSFAAPVIAGYAALILAKHPGLTPFQVKTVLQATADNAAPTA